MLALRIKKAVRKGATLVVADPRAIWLTKIAKRHLQLRPGSDVWLRAGESASVAPDEEVVIEAWPQARFAVLESPAAAPRRLSAARAAAWARRLRERLQWTQRPSWCGA